METVKVILDNSKSCTISNITAVISCITTIITMVITFFYVKYTKGILKANRESAEFAKEQLKANGEQQKETIKTSLYSERLKIYCRWIGLIEDARGEKRSYTIEEKTSLLNGTKFLFGDEAKNKLKYFLCNYEMYCQLERSLENRNANVTINSLSEKEKEMYYKFRNATNVIDEALGDDLILYKEERKDE